MVIYGAGPIGIMAAYLSQKLFKGGKVILVDPIADRLEIAESWKLPNVVTIRDTAYQSNLSLEEKIIKELDG